MAVRRAEARGPGLQELEPNWPGLIQLVIVINHFSSLLLIISVSDNTDRKTPAVRRGHRGMEALEDLKSIFATTWPKTLDSSDLVKFRRVK